LAVVLGAIGVFLGFPQADPIVGLLITVAILWVLKGAALQIFARLMDAVDPALTEAVERAAAQPGVVEVTSTRLRWIGHRIEAEAHVTVDANRRPSLVILDEPTSSIDAVDELPLLRRVLAHLSGHVVFLVTHRLQCVQFADQVVLVEPGGVMTVGPHVELKARSTWYRAAYDAQAQSFDAIDR
jgi:ABC-type Na+ transport system ATPase subunit NatA